MLASEIQNEVRRTQRTAVIKQQLWLAIPVVIGGILTLIEMKNWEPWDWVLYGLIGLIPAVLVLETIARAKRESALLQDRTDRSDLTKACAALAVEVHEITDIKVTALGVSVWRIYTPARPWWRRWKRAEALERIERFRLGGHPPPSDSSWTKGKGVIGKCWEDGRETFNDWGAAQARHAGVTALSNAQWGRLTEAHKWGFGREHYLAAIKKYAQVLAYPITDVEGKFIGCVSVDIPTAEDGLIDPVPENALGAGAVRSVVARSAVTLRRWI